MPSASENFCCPEKLIVDPVWVVPPGRSADLQQPRAHSAGAHVLCLSNPTLVSFCKRKSRQKNLVLTDFCFTEVHWSAQLLYNTWNSKSIFPSQACSKFPEVQVWLNGRREKPYRRIQNYGKSIMKTKCLKHQRAPRAFRHKSPHSWLNHR